ncbi:hypothetical protein [Aureimonas sp. Leaf324]|uniref:hypothetical protein n=1 Tax=Aureimonas sp. Leaf324 TaxID=1736336 RepID=UPI0006FBA3E6|nr:hypothetical protein [Aureimonas sp. Leaf324]KQQ78988.1 hypothetical protein ASF65_14020 [Aureimonas sp. Leaf324]
MEPRLVRIFVSTPSDIQDERKALRSLVAEINDVVMFLAPERNVTLRLVDYKGDAHPDMGDEPQAVIDRQIPPDYDIHFGMMWKRCGTATKGGADSGTVHEFNQALARREKTGKPTIMFYFSGEPSSPPTSPDEVDQLTKVMKFRQRIEAIGLTGAYPTRAEFSEHARLGLLQAVRNILREELPKREVEPAPPTHARMSQRLRELCEAYDAVRNDLQPGPNRTRRMTDIIEEMKAEAPAARSLLTTFMEHSSAGYRLAAIGILQMFPAVDQLTWLADRLNPDLEKPFIGYQAAIALLQAVRGLPNSDCQNLRTEVTRARTLAQRNADDLHRISALDYALKELAKKCG